MIKRLTDIICSGLGLIILSPLFLVVAFWIKLDSPGPAFFRQFRVGRHQKQFRIYKFRTMIVNAESQGRQITVGEDPRITSAGRFLRHYKLDELPQLINVFKGEMSLVGPRPEVPRYVEMFKALYAPILEIKPGITDFAAIEFRNEEDVLKNYSNSEEGYIKEVLPKKIALYKRYLKEKSLTTDLKLIFLTMRKIFQ